MPSIRRETSGPDPITDRQLELLRLCAGGYTEPQIGARLGLSRNTIKEHLYRLRTRLKAVNTTHAVVLAIQQGMLDPSRVPRRRVRRGIVKRG